MISIERITAHVATFRQPALLTHLFGTGLSVMATRTQRGELVESRKWLAAILDTDAMIYCDRRFNSANLQACLAERMKLQLLPAEALPLLGGVWPLRHLSPYQSPDVDHRGGRFAIPIAIVNATSGSIRPWLRRLESFRLPAASSSALALVAAIVRTGWLPCSSCPLRPGARAGRPRAPYP